VSHATPLPTTAEYVETFAARGPQRAALDDGGSPLTYGQLANALLQCGLHLQRLGVQRGHRVAVSGPGFGVQLVLLLAAEALGAVTLSFEAQGDPDLAFVLSHADHVFSALPQAVPAGVRFHRIDPAFADALAVPLAGPGPDWNPLPLEAPQRISRTSGSSGASKFMVLSRLAQEWWIRTALDSVTWQVDTATRLLLLSPLVINAGFARASACLRRGGLVMAGTGGDVERLQPTHVLGLPLHLQRLLDELPAGYRSPHPTSVATFGGALPPDLRQRAEAAFGGLIHNRYGSNETAVVCGELDASGTGVISAGVQVRILDEEGRVLPHGQPGIVAIRSPGLVDGYIDRPEESAAAFREGWFVSGDVGVMAARRVLRLLGRHDDLVNFAGLKRPAWEIEAQVRGHPAFQDAAAVAIHLAGGATTLGLAIVLAPGVAVEEGRRVLEQVLRLPAPAGVRWLFLSTIPRLASGKTDRMGLLRLFGESR
jgi:acyl-coenzyme A synthetase/AMP-(fatty) acid ligase